LRYEIKENQEDVIQWGLTSPGDSSFNHIKYLIPFVSPPTIRILTGCIRDNYSNKITNFTNYVQNSSTGFSRDSWGLNNEKCNVYWIVEGKKAKTDIYKNGLKI
jgi:hypothetical protein